MAPPTRTQIAVLAVISLLLIFMDGNPLPPYWDYRDLLVLFGVFGLGASFSAIAWRHVYLASKEDEAKTLEAARSKQSEEVAGQIGNLSDRMSLVEERQDFSERILQSKEAQPIATDPRREGAEG